MQITTNAGEVADHGCNTDASFVTPTFTDPTTLVVELELVGAEVVWVIVTGTVVALVAVEVEPIFTVGSAVDLETASDVGGPLPVVVTVTASVSEVRSGVVTELVVEFVVVVVAVVVVVVPTKAAKATAVLKI